MKIRERKMHDFNCTCRPENNEVCKTCASLGGFRASFIVVRPTIGFSCNWQRARRMLQLLS